MTTFTATIRRTVIANGHYCAGHCPQLNDSGKFAACRLFMEDLGAMQAGRAVVYHRCADCFECEGKDLACVVPAPGGMTSTITAGKL